MNTNTIITDSQNNELKLFARMICRTELNLNEIPNIFYGHSVMGPYYDVEKNFILLERKYNKTIKSILCHELRHFWQAKNRLLLFKNNCSHWNNIPIMNHWNLSHYNLPWERDAVQFEYYCEKKYNLNPQSRPLLEYSQYGVDIKEYQNDTRNKKSA